MSENAFRCTFELDEWFMWGPNDTKTFLHAQITKWGEKKTHLSLKQVVKMCRVTWLEPHLLISWLRRLFSLSSYMNFVFKPPVSFWLTASCSLWWAFVILLSRFILMLRLQVEDTTGPCASSLSSHPDACVLATQLIPAVSCLLQSKLTSVMCMV